MTNFISKDDYIASLKKELKEAHQEVGALQAMKDFISKDDHIASLRKELKEAHQEVGALQAQLRNVNYIRYCMIVRNEIEKLDELFWDTTPTTEYFHEIQDIYYKYHVDYKNYIDQEQNKRRLRIFHIMKYNSSSRITSLREQLEEADIPGDVFAEKIAAAFTLITEEFHQTAYLVALNRDTCDTVTPYEEVNSCINFLMKNVETNVGQMIPKLPEQSTVDRDASVSAKK